MLQQQALAVSLTDRQRQLRWEFRLKVRRKTQEKHAEAAALVHVLDMHQPSFAHDRHSIGHLLDLRQDMA